MIRAIPNIQIASMMCENEAFVRCFLQIPKKIRKVEDVKKTLSYEASMKLQELKLSEHVFKAAVPMHKVSEQTQNTIAQHHQRKSHLKPSVTLRAQSELDFTLKR